MPPNFILQRLNGDDTFDKAAEFGWRLSVPHFD